MNNTAKSIQLIRALHQMVPDAALSLIDETPWYSSTFSGARMCIVMTFPVGHRPASVARFEQELRETEFELNGQLVADIAVTDEITSEANVRLIIEALLLDA